MAKPDQGTMRGLASIVGSGGGGGRRKFDPETFQENLQEMGYGIAQAQAMAMAIGNILGGGKQQESSGTSLKDITGAMKDLHELAGGTSTNGKSDGLLSTIKALKELGFEPNKGEDREVGLAKVGVEREATQGNLAMAVLDRMGNGGGGGGNHVLDTISALKELGLLGPNQQQGQNSLLDTIKALKELGMIGQQKQTGGLDETLGMIGKLKELGMVNGPGGNALSFEQQMALKNVEVQIARIMGEQRLQEQQISHETSQHENGTKAISDVIGFLREQQAQGNAPPGPEADGDMARLKCQNCGGEFVTTRPNPGDVVTCTNCGSKWRKTA